MKKSCPFILFIHVLHTYNTNLKEHQLSLWSRRCQGKLKIQESVWQSLSSFFFYASKSKHKQGILLMMKVRRLFFHFLVKKTLLLSFSRFYSITIYNIISLISHSKRKKKFKPFLTEKKGSWLFDPFFNLIFLQVIS